MNLQELLTRHAQRPTHSVPDWMLGYFKRYAISFADGTTDLQTNVCWIQSRNFTIDLRLPITSQQVAAKKLADYSANELNTLANYEGWEALCDWEGETLSWRETDCSLQLHNRWTEPGVLKRYGNCMIELAPSGAYVEDWRLQPSVPGPLVGLLLIEERNLATGVIRHRGGGLIICGEYAALVLGRAQPIASTQPYNSLRKLAQDAQGQPEKLAALFNFETSVATGSITDGYHISLSTKPERIGESLCALDGFELLAEQSLIRQTFIHQGTSCERIFSIDTLEPEVQFNQATGFTPEAQEWYEREAQTLTRYTKALF
jgi:hypothetical protein